MIQVGDVIAGTLVLEVLPKRRISGRNRQVYLVRCHCGNQLSVTGWELTRRKNGDIKGCRKCYQVRLRSAQVGDRFDKLVIVDISSQLKSSNGKRVTTKAICRCDCGKVITRVLTLLPKNKTNNCGCDWRGGYKGFKDIPGKYLSQIERHASDRGLDFSVSPELLWDVFVAQDSRCALSGLPIGFPKKGGTEKTTASLDRIDSLVGYIPGNVQWVHKDVNRLKMDLHEDRLLELCVAIAKHNGFGGDPA